MNSVKNGEPLTKIVDNNVNIKVKVPPIQTKEIKIKIFEKSNLMKNGNVT